MATRPATSLFNAITGQLKRNRPPHRISISRRTLQQWQKWAKSINASMRLDGSPLSKRKKARR